MVHRWVTACWVTYPFRCSLGLVQWDQSGDHSDAVTSEEATRCEHRNIGCNSLENNADTEHDHGDHQSIATAEEVGGGCCCESAEEGTSGL